MKSLNEIAVDYYEAVKLLNRRIRELTERKEKAIAVCRKLHQDPKYDVAVIELEDRLRPLVNMKNDLVEVSREVQHYYDRWWWRSGKYTCNQNKPAPAKCDEEFYKYGYSISSYRKTKNSNQFVLCRRKNNGRNSRDNGNKESSSVSNT